MLLEDLVENTEPGAFDVFCNLLNDTDNKKLAKTLHDDRYNIVWGKLC